MITYSQAFDDAAWTKGGVGTFTSAITTGFTDPTGGTNAQRWLATIASVSDRAFVRQLAILTSGAPYTISFWVKSNTASSQDIYFLFQSGAVQATTATTSWQRISYSATTSTTSVLVGIEAKDLAIDVLVYGFQLDVGNVMTDYIATTSAAVSVGPVANVPRLDYLGSSCPRLLLEPQRTNAILWSEQIDNAGWSKINAPTITTNIATAPDGYGGADGIQDTTGGTYKRVRQSFSVAANGTHTASVFVKKETSETNYGGLALVFTNRFVYGIIDAVNGTLTVSSDSYIASSSTKVEDYGTYWRFSLTATDDQSNTSLDITYYATLSTNGTSTGVGAG